MSAPRDRADEAEIREALGLNHAAGDVFAVRALGFGNRGAVAEGYFNDLDKAAHEIARLDARSDVQGIYATLNTVAPDCLARAANRCKSATTACSDKDILRRDELLVDLDPVRATGISATDAELAAALERMEQVRDDLTALGWPEPVEVMSGNGGHLRYQIAGLPNDDSALALVKRVLGALDLRYSDERVAVDVSVSNAARLVRVPGTVARKGDNILDRPHRRAQIIKAPAELAAVSREQLEALVGATLPTETPKLATRESALDLDAFIQRNGIEVLREGGWDGVGRKYVLRVCPFDPSHAGGCAVLLRFASGAIAFRCQHNSCSARRWREFHERFEPRETSASNNGARSNAAPAGGPASGEALLTREIRLRLVSAADVEVKRTEWLEPYRIPLGKFALLEGAGDLGKTTLVMGLLATATRGEHFFPLEEADARLYPPKTRRVLVVAREDDLGILKARLVAAKAVLDRVTFIDGRDLIDADGNVEEADTSFMLPRDIEPLIRAIEKTQADVVYIDALHSHVLVEGDAKSPQDVRRTYHKIVEMLNTTGATLLSTRHFGKGIGRASDRGLGSSEIGHVARAILSFGKHPEGEGRLVVAQTKKNLSKAMPTIEYRLDILDVTDDAGNAWTVTKAVVEGVAESVTADDLAMALPVDRETRTLKEEATQAILAAFSDGETITAEELDKARKDAGCTPRTWERARADLTRSHVLHRSREGTDGPVIYAIDHSRIRLFAKDPRSSPNLGVGEQRPCVANNGDARTFATAARRAAKADRDCLSEVLANPVTTMTARPTLGAHDEIEVEI